MITVTCTQCGIKVKRKPHHVKITENPFCGFACYGEWQRTHRKGIGRKRVGVICHTCGKAFNKRPCELTDHNFCSRACFAKWRSSDAWTSSNNPVWKGGHTAYRGPNWKRQSAKARERDGNTCQKCGAKDDGLAVHHTIPYHLFDDYRQANRLSNLVTLCPKCHADTELGFWAENPGLIEQRRFPECALSSKTCGLCGQDFQPRSPVSKVCDACCTFTCAHCGDEFYTRKLSDRTPKYCSRDCRNADTRTDNKVCPDCGGAKHHNAIRCRDCDMAWYHADPAAPRRGRKPSL